MRVNYQTHTSLVEGKLRSFNYSKKISAAQNSPTARITAGSSSGKITARTACLIADLIETSPEFSTLSQYIKKTSNEYLKELAKDTLTDMNSNIITSYLSKFNKDYSMRFYFGDKGLEISSELFVKLLAEENIKYNVLSPEIKLYLICSIVQQDICEEFKNNSLTPTLSKPKIYLILTQNAGVDITIKLNAKTKSIVSCVVTKQSSIEFKNKKYIYESKNKIHINNPLVAIIRPRENGASYFFCDAKISRSTGEWLGFFTPSELINNKSKCHEFIYPGKIIEFGKPVCNSYKQVYYYIRNIISSWLKRLHYFFSKHYNLEVKKRIQQEIKKNVDVFIEKNQLLYIYKQIIEDILANEFSAIKTDKKSIPSSDLTGCLGYINHQKLPENLIDFLKQEGIDYESVSLLGGGGGDNLAETISNLVEISISHHISTKTIDKKTRKTLMFEARHFYISQVEKLIGIDKEYKRITPPNKFKKTLRLLLKKEFPDLFSQKTKKIKPLAPVK